MRSSSQEASRRGRTARRTAVVTATVLAMGTALGGSAGLAADPALAAPQAGPSWHVVKRVNSGPSGDFTAVTAVGADGGWAFDAGSKPTAWQRSGGAVSAWTQVSFPGTSNEIVVAAGAASPTDVWAFTGGAAQSRALRWNGSAWTVQRAFSHQIGGAVVISATDIWVFGEPYVPDAGLGAWHYNGSVWSRVASGHGLQGGSGLSADDIWAFDGADVAHWNGVIWSRTSVASLLPARTEFNDPMLTGIYAASKDSVYAVANGNAEDEGGPLVILHWDGHHWRKVAEGDYGFGVQPVQQVTSDGHGGLWLPMPGDYGQKSYLLHYSAGHLSEASLPGSPYKIGVNAVALIPGSTELLVGGNAHAYDHPGADVTALILEYEP